MFENVAHGLTAELFLPVETIDMAGQEKFCQKRNVLPALAERRQGDVDNLQTIVNILPELARRDAGGQIPVGRGNDAYIRPDGLCTADAGDFSVLQDPEDLGLGGQGHIADLVEKDRSAVGQLEFALALLERPGEGPFFVTEQFAFHQRFGNGCAVDNDVTLYRRMIKVYLRYDPCLSGALKDAAGTLCI